VHLADSTGLHIKVRLYSGFPKGLADLTAIVRRDGFFSNAYGPHDLNLQLYDPLTSADSAQAKTFCQDRANH
jgi:hypothetical protein